LARNDWEGTASTTNSASAIAAAGSATAVSDGGSSIEGK
jgi:hypothetical protein